MADGNQGDGITGYVSGAVTMTGCYNTGDIEGQPDAWRYYIRRLPEPGPKPSTATTQAISRQSTACRWSHCMGSPTNGVVEGCWNTGYISSTSESRPQGCEALMKSEGLAGSNAASFINCYNAGTVEGLSRVGGLVGNTTKGKTSFTNCPQCRQDYSSPPILAGLDCGHKVSP